MHTKSELHWLMHHVAYLTEILTIMDKRGQLENALAQLALKHAKGAQEAINGLNQT